MYPVLPALDDGRTGESGKCKMVAAGRSDFSQNHAAIFHLHVFNCGNSPASKEVLYLAFQPSLSHTTPKINKYVIEIQQ